MSRHACTHAASFPHESQVPSDPPDESPDEPPDESPPEDESPEEPPEEESSVGNEMALDEVQSIAMLKGAIASRRRVLEKCIVVLKLKMHFGTIH